MPGLVNRVKKASQLGWQTLLWGRVVQVESRQIPGDDEREDVHARQRRARGKAVASRLRSQE